MTNTRKFEHISPKLRELNWLPVKLQLLFREALWCKCVHNLAPHYLCNNFMKCLYIHEHHTRNRDLFQIPLYNTTSGHRTFHYRGPKLWNELDKELKQASSLKSFMKKLKKDMLDSYYNYSCNSGNFIFYCNYFTLTKTF